MAHREPLSAVDAAWLRMDSPENLMMITVVQRFDAPLDPVKVRETLERLVRQSPRFGRRVTGGGRLLARAAWEDDPDFDVGRHLRVTELAPPCGDAELRALVSARMSVALDRARPLWSVDLVPRVGSGAALVVRIHHAVADGIALVRAMLALTDEGKDMQPQEVGVAATPTLADLRARARLDIARARALAKLVLIPPDTRTILRGPLGSHKRAAWSAPFTVDSVHAVAHARGATLNDVLVGATAGALRGYLDGRNALPHRGLVRAIVTVYLKGARGAEAGNHFGLAYLGLPLLDADRDRRVAEVKRGMDAIKASPEAAVAFGILGAMGMATPSLERLAITIFSSKATILTTNVPGPPSRMHIAGVPLASITVWAPTSGSIGVGATFQSYAGEVRLGLGADARLVPDPENVVALFERELLALGGVIGSRRETDGAGAAVSRA